LRKVASFKPLALRRSYNAHASLTPRAWGGLYDDFDIATE
jgi:hypothetical protein